MSATGFTPSQTAGPFLSIGTRWSADGSMLAPGSAGGRVIAGTVSDGAGVAVTDAMLEFWQADAAGRFPPDADPEWRGFTRALTDSEGRYRLVTVVPGRVPAADGAVQAPHIDMSIFARGLMQRLVTRIYFADEEAANDADPVLGTVPPPDRVRLLAVPDDSGGGYRFDIKLQGDDETVFFVPW